MAETTVEQLLEEATRMAFERWSLHHPSLARVIDSLVVRQRTADSIRTSQAFHEAVASYHEARQQQDLLQRLTSVAETLIPLVLGL